MKFQKFRVIREQEDTCNPFSPGRPHARTASASFLHLQASRARGAGHTNGASYFCAQSGISSPSGTYCTSSTARPPVVAAFVKVMTPPREP